MKKVLSVALILAVVVGMCVLGACKSKPQNVNQDLKDFDSYVAENSSILGEWELTSTEDQISWRFFATTTVHKTTTNDAGVQYSAIFAFNYNDETGELLLRGRSVSAKESYTVKIDDISMTLTSDTGEVLTFMKIS